MVGLPRQQRELGALVALRSAAVSLSSTSSNRRNESNPHERLCCPDLFYTFGRLLSGAVQDWLVLVKTPRTERSHQSMANSF